MSACIIPMRHRLRLIELYMGKLRFTLTNIIFWIVLLLSCFLSENFAILNSDPLGGFSFDSAFILTGAIIGLLILYYFLEHKKNGLTLDRVLLPSIIIAGLLLIWTVLRQDHRTFADFDGTGTFEVSFSKKERIMASLQVVIWLAVIYALDFVYNRFRLNKESYRWVGKVYLASVLIMVLIDIFYEGDSIVAIFNGTYTGGGLQFVMGNANVWALLLFAGFLTTVVLSYKRFRIWYYIPMMFLYTFSIMTTCATTTFIGAFVIVAYTLYEILSCFKENKKQSIKHLIIFIGSLTIVGLLLAMLVLLIKVPMFVNYWEFVDSTTFHKNFFTMTGRTTIWKKILELLKANPLDLIFGLGHQTASSIFRTYVAESFGVKSAHNAVMEVFLRYGLFGIVVYLLMIGLTAFCLIRSFIKKRYRFTVIYGLCFVAIMAHSMTESTTLFTPNVGGLYFSFVFILPVLNILQEKRFKALKADLLTVNVQTGKIKERTYFVVFIYVLLAVVITKIVALIFPIDLFSSLLVLLGILTAGLVFAAIYKNKSDYNPLRILSHNNLMYYRNLVAKENDDEE